jgi:hypothetical protein
MSSENNVFKLRRTIETRAKFASATGGIQNERARSFSLESLAREQTEQAINIVVGIMNAPTASDRDKLTAAFGLLDWGWDAD